MSHLNLYNAAICSQLRDIAENRQWHQWDTGKAKREDLIEEVELTYHLHLAAEASGARAGMPPMPTFPLSFRYPDGTRQPAEFLLQYFRRHPPRPWNQSDNARQIVSACA